MASTNVTPTQPPAAAAQVRAQTIAALPKAPVGALKPVINLADYTEVVIAKSGAIGDHPYRRGQKLFADAATLTALKAQNMV